MSKRKNPHFSLLLKFRAGGPVILKIKNIGLREYLLLTPSINWL